MVSILITPILSRVSISCKSCYPVKIFHTELPDNAIFFAKFNKIKIGMSLSSDLTTSIIIRVHPCHKLRKILCVDLHIIISEIAAPCLALVTALVEMDFDQDIFPFHSLAGGFPIERQGGPLFHQI